jgi:hypothetical protein
MEEPTVNNRWPHQTNCPLVVVSNLETFEVGLEMVTLNGHSRRHLEDSQLRDSRKLGHVVTLVLTLDYSRQTSTA